MFLFSLLTLNPFRYQYKNLGGLRFGVDGDGNGGYYKADDSFVPFSSGISNLVLFILGRDATYGTYCAYTENGKDFVSKKRDEASDLPWGKVDTGSGNNARLTFNQPVYTLIRLGYSEAPTWTFCNSGDSVQTKTGNTSCLIAFIPADKFKY